MTIGKIYIGGFLLTFLYYRYKQYLKYKELNLKYKKLHLKSNEKFDEYYLNDLSKHIIFSFYWPISIAFEAERNIMGWMLN